MSGRDTALVRSWRRRLYLGPARRLLKAARVDTAVALARLPAAIWRGARYRPGRPAVVEVGGQVVRLVAPTREDFRELAAAYGERRLLARLLKHVRPGDIVYDIGANVGVYTVALARAVGPSGRVLAFEPEPRAQMRLVENVRLNVLDNVDLDGRALGRRPGRATLLAGQRAASGVHRVVALAPPDGPARLAVEVTNGDDLVCEALRPKPAVLKIDVEGAELDVLEGFAGHLRTPRCRVVLCEVHFSLLAARGLPDGPRRIEQLLAESGFQQIDWVDASHLLAVKAPPAS